MGHLTEASKFAAKYPDVFERKRDEAMPLAFAWLEIHGLLPPKRFLPEIAPHMSSNVLDRSAYRELQSGICPLCMEKMPKKLRPPKNPKQHHLLPPNVRHKVRATMRWTVTRDHIHPLADNGLDVVFNVVATHGKCNHAKGDLPLIMFLWAKATGKVNFVRQSHVRPASPTRPKIREARQMTAKQRAALFASF